VHQDAGHGSGEWRHEARFPHVVLAQLHFLLCAREVGGLHAQARRQPLDRVFAVVDLLLRERVSRHPDARQLLFGGIEQDPRFLDLRFRARQSGLGGLQRNLLPLPPQLDERIALGYLVAFLDQDPLDDAGGLGLHDRLVVRPNHAGEWRLLRERDGARAQQHHGEHRRPSHRPSARLRHHAVCPRHCVATARPGAASSML
jgi:hypothetical protein